MKQDFDWMPNNETYIALQSVGLLSPGDVHVGWQSRILVEESPVVGLGCQVLSLLGMADVDHVQINTGDEIHLHKVNEAFCSNMTQDVHPVLLVL